jgi:phosphopantothenoylcysteine decarboxylase/phosphopantothenate--cysteine ligase
MSAPGRMADLGAIVDSVEAIVRGFRGPLTGRRVLITAGGTREALDPVRVLTNRSSGHQGYALAEVAARGGAEVTLVTSAKRELALDVRRSIDVVAVGVGGRDGRSGLRARRSERHRDHGRRRGRLHGNLGAAQDQKGPVASRLELEPTQDILATLGAQRRDGQILVGFAAETREALEEGRRKLERKRCDLLVVNDVSADGVGFDHATNAVTILSATQPDRQIDLTSKEEVALEILASVASLLPEGES